MKEEKSKYFYDVVILTFVVPTTHAGNDLGTCLTYLCVQVMIFT